MPSHSSVAKQVLRTARKTTRRQDYSSSTQKALLSSATELFTERGYAGTSLDEVVAAARVTKGALYHHFSSKLALFEAVFLEVQRKAMVDIEKALKRADDPWEQANVGLTRFLEVCRRPEFRRICLQEGPVALGHERWQELEREASYGLVDRTVRALLAELGEAEEFSDAFAALFYGAVRSASEFIADADDQDAASAQVEGSIQALLAGLRMLPTVGESDDATEEA